MSALRQSIWRMKGEHRGNDRLTDELPDDDHFTDKVKWIDTMTMACDSLTKIMDTGPIVSFTSSNTWSITQPHKSKVMKLAKQLARRKQDNEELDDPN